MQKKRGGEEGKGGGGGEGEGEGEGERGRENIKMISHVTGI